MDLTRYRGLIFDLDGTLVDSMPLHLAAWSHAADIFGFRYDADWFYRLGGVPGKKIARMLTKEQALSVDPDDVARIKSDHYRKHLEQATTIKVTCDIVNRYHGKLPMAIGTGSPRANTERVLANTGLDRLIDVVITADDVDNHKPNPDTFLLAARRLGLAPDQCLVFEDTPIGAEAARSAGMDCLLVQQGELGEINAPVAA